MALRRTRCPGIHWCAGRYASRCAGRCAGLQAGIRSSAGIKRSAGVHAGMSVAALLALLATTGLNAQNPYPEYTADHLAGTMETVGPNFDAGVRALDAADYATAKERFVRAREQLATTITFWRQNDRDDATQWVRDAITQLDSLDNTLSQESIDGAVAAGQAQEIETTCNACHAVYREQDPATGEYRLKSGAVG